MDGKRVSVELGPRSYDVHVAADITRHVGALIRQRLPKAQLGIITDETVWRLHGHTLAQSLSDADYRVPVAAIAPGEKSKTLDTVGELYERCLDWHLTRTDAVVAFGGGVVGDIAGFVAATYLRGIAVFHVPTTVVACVDSSVGGKTGVDLDRGKNLVGAFHQPAGVYADPTLLATLDRREFAGGLAEVVKYGVIMDADFFRFIQQNIEGVLSVAPETMLEVITRSCNLKALVVTQDEREQGRRAILNYGHTFGHGLETASGYGKYLHGEAVSIGMVAAAGVARVKGLIVDEAAEAQRGLLVKLGLPVAPDGDDIDKAIAHMRYDKKLRGANLRMVLPIGIGQVVVEEVDDATVRKGLRYAFGV